MNSLGALTITDKGYPGKVGSWLGSSTLIPPVPNWLLVTGLAWWGFAAAQSKSRGRR